MTKLVGIKGNEIADKL